MSFEQHPSAFAPTVRVPGPPSPQQPARNDAAAELTATPERTVARLRPHARRCVLPAISLIALATATPWLFGVLEVEWQRIALLIGGALALIVLCIMPFARWLNRVTTVTSHRLIVRRGVFTRDQRTVVYSRGASVQLKRGPLQRAFGSGTIILRTPYGGPTGEGGAIFVQDVPRAALVADAIEELIGERVSEAHELAARQARQRTGDAPLTAQASARPRWR